MTKVKSREEFLIVASGWLPMQCDAVEIGVLHGDFSKKILEFIEPGKLFLIDPYTDNGTKYEGCGGLLTAYSNEEDYSNLLKRLEVEIESGQVVVNKNFSYNAVKEFEDNSIDCVYIDASHLYFDVKKDMNDWLPKLKINGLMCGHDYIHLGNFGVIQAVDDFIKEHGFEIIVYNENGGDWALKKVT